MDSKAAKAVKFQKQPNRQIDKFEILKLRPLKSASALVCAPKSRASRRELER